MKDYIRYFETNSAYNNDRQNNYWEPWVSLTEENGEVHYNKKSTNWAEQPLTFEILTDGTITWERSNTSTTTKTIEYRKNNGEWTSITSATNASATPIEVVTGDLVEFRGDNSSYGYGMNYGTIRANKFNVTCQYNIKGNIMSLLDKENFTTQTSLSSNYTFYYLFSATPVINANNLILPATTLIVACYSNMFRGCTSLLTAPELPATSAPSSCYSRMFCGCASLTTAPNLPATIVESSCYLSMFQGCTSLTNVPSILPATTVSNACYMNMFTNCTSLTTAPELPASSLYEFCYLEMFKDCTNLEYVKCLATSIEDTPTSSDPTENWLQDVAESGIFVKDSTMTDWLTGDSGIPSGWTVENYTNPNTPIAN